MRRLFLVSEGHIGQSCYDLRFAWGYTVLQVCDLACDKIDVIGRLSRIHLCSLAILIKHRAEVQSINTQAMHNSRLP